MCKDATGRRIYHHVFFISQSEPLHCSEKRALYQIKTFYHHLSHYHQKQTYTTRRRVNSVHLFHFIFAFFLCITNHSLVRLLKSWTSSVRTTIFLLWHGDFDPQNQNQNRTRQEIELFDCMVERGSTIASKFARNHILATIGLNV